MCSILFSFIANSIPRSIHSTVKFPPCFSKSGKEMHSNEPIPCTCSEVMSTISIPN